MSGERARTRLLLAGILVLAAALRLVGLGSRPAGLHPDEAADAYEAWTLARTGHASDGRAWPLVFPHHGVDWVEGTYVWLEAPFVALAPDPWLEAACRLPAALAGTLAVLATFVLGRRLGGTRLGLLAAAILAVEPWAVHHSRFGERASLEPLLVAAGLAFGLAGLEEERGELRGALGGAVLGLAAVNYPPARVVLPVVALGFAWANPGPWRRRLAFLAPLGLALALVAPWALSDRGSLRAREVLVASPLEAVVGYLVHFSPRALFSGDPGQGFAAKGCPPLLALEAPFLVLGILRLARERGPRARALGVWLLAWPLAAALTERPPNLLRAIFGLPLFALLGALGVDALLDRLARKRAPARRAVLLLLGALAVASVGLAAHRYAVVFPTTRSAWAPYAREREKVSGLTGEAVLTLPNERALVDLYARERERRWLAPDRVVLGAPK